MIPPDASPACAGAPDAVMFPEHPGDPTSWIAARALCAVCPLTAACLTVALDSEGGGGAQMRHGMWGGTTPAERARMVKARRPRLAPTPSEACGTTSGYGRHMCAGESACDPCREAWRLACLATRARRREAGS